MQLAAAYYGQPDLAQRILGPDQNPSQIFEEPTVKDRLQSGELDAASAYRLQPAAFGLLYLALPAQMISATTAATPTTEKAALTLSGKTYHPEPLVYYAAILNDAAHPQQAAAFVAFLAGREGQALFRQANYDPLGKRCPAAGVSRAQLTASTTLPN
jgi:molybdate/tungstate transport system substrate-binding protein